VRSWRFPFGLLRFRAGIVSPDPRPFAMFHRLDLSPVGFSLIYFAGALLSLLLSSSSSTFVVDVVVVVVVVWWRWRWRRFVVPW
jgi:hypothetical protein